MTDILSALAVAVLVGVICAVVLFGIKGSTRIADPPRRDWHGDLD